MTPAEGVLCIREFLPNSKKPANCQTGLVQFLVELQVLLSALIFHYKNKKKIIKKNQLHEWITQPLLPVKTITRIKGQTYVKLLPKKLLGSYSLIQREVGILLSLTNYLLLLLCHQVYVTQDRIYVYVYVRQFAVVENSCYFMSKLTWQLVGRRHACLLA